MQLLFCRLTFTENDAFIRTDSLVTLCGATLLCRVTQFPVCAVQNLRGRCGDNLWRDFLLCFTLHHICYLCSDEAWCCMVFFLLWCSTNFVHSRYYLCCLSQYKVQKEENNLLQWQNSSMQSRRRCVRHILGNYPAIITGCDHPASVITALINHTRHTSNQAHNLLRNPLLTAEKTQQKRNDFETSKNTGDNERTKDCKSAKLP